MKHVKQRIPLGDNGKAGLINQFRRFAVPVAGQGVYMVYCETVLNRGQYFAGASSVFDQ
jgi:hypothetical protein